MGPPGDDFEGGDPDDRFEGRRDHEGTGDVPPPTERVWRHPSELQSSPAGSNPWRSAAASTSAVDSYAWRVARHRRRLVLMGLVGTAAIAAAVSAVGLLWEASSSQFSTTTDAAPLLSHVLTTDDLTSRTPAVPQAAVSAVRSLVALRVVTAERTTVVCGMAVGYGGLVAAPAAALARADGRILLATAGGTAPATEVGVDPASDVALVRVPAALQPPSFADDGAMAPGGHATVVSVTTGRGAAAALDWSTATISSVAAPVPAGTASGIAGIVADVPSAPHPCGALLLDSDGAVMGLLGGSSAAGSEVFLPAPLVVGVSDQLALAGTVRHGWLDVSGTDAPGSSDGGWGGVVVRDVDPTGAAAGSLHSGDVILFVSGEPVRSMAELRTRLYVLPPGAAVALEILRGGHRTAVDVELGSSP